MLQHILLFITLLLYSIIVSQSLSYIISLRRVQQALDAPGYLNWRKLTDQLFHQRFRPVVYASLVSNLALVIVSALFKELFLFGCSTMAFVALVADTWVAVKGNLPINAIINQWTPQNIPADWQLYRRRWLQLFSVRQVLNIIGYTSLLAAAVFRHL